MNLDAARAPDFLLRLADVYFDHHLIDSALQALGEISREHSLYPIAAQHMLRIYTENRNAQAFLGLCEDLRKRDLGSIVPHSQLGQALYRAGQTVEAGKYLYLSMEHLPENAETLSVAEPSGAKDPPPNLRAHIDHFAQLGVGCHFLFDCVAPLLWGGRTATLCFEDTFRFLTSASDSTSTHRNNLLRFAAYLYKQFGIYMACLRYVSMARSGDCAPIGKIYFSRSASLFDRVRRLEDLFWREFHDGTWWQNPCEGFLRTEGSLLGYPDCCRSWAAEVRSSGESIETFALAELIREDWQAMYLHPGGDRPTEFSYYAFEFYPCKPRCRAAESIGRAILERYSHADSLLADRYRNRVLPLNKARIWKPDACYLDFVRDFEASVWWESLAPVHRLYRRVLLLSKTAFGRSHA